MIIATVRGNVGNVELKHLPDGTPVLEVSIASNDRVRGAELTTWVRASIFGKRGEALARVVDKGMSVMVVGLLTVREYEGKNGKGVSVGVRVDQFDFCGGGKPGGASPNPTSGASGTRSGGDGASAAPQADGGADDDIPF